MSSNPLAWLPLTIGAIGYVYTVFQEFQDTGSIRLIPMYRGKLGDILKVIEGGQASVRHPLLDQIEYLSESEKDEVLLINYRFGEIAGILNSAPPKVRFDLYRHVCGQFHARRDLLTGEEVAHYVNNAVSEDRRALPQQQKPVIEQEGTRAVLPQTVEQQPAVSDQTTANNQQPITQPETALLLDPTSEQVGLEILDTLATTRRSTLLIGDTGAGKSVTQSYVLTKLFELHPDAQVFVLSQKADSFCGLAEKGRVILFDPTEPEDALALICQTWNVYDRRRRLPEAERQGLPPVRLILADWLSINQALEELKNEESVKTSKYLTKLADLVYNGRELNVCLLVDLQSYNLAAVGLKADRNSRKNFNLIGLGNYSIDELGMVNESYGVLTNLIGDRYIVSDESERTALNATFKKLQPISKANCRPIIFSGLSPARLALLPDLRRFKSSTVASKQPITVAEPSSEMTTADDIRERLEALIKATPKEKELPSSQIAKKLLEIVQSAAKQPISFESIRKSRKWEGSSPDKASLLAALDELSSEWIRGNEAEGYYLQD